GDVVVDGGFGCGHVVPPSCDAGLHSIDRPTDMESDVGPVLHGVYLLDEFGYELGGAGRTIGLDVAVADELAGQFGDAGGDEVGVGGGVIHALAGAVAGGPGADWGGRL